MGKVCSVSILLFCAITVVLAKIDESIFTDEMKALMKTLHDTCVEKSNAKEDIIEKYKEGDLVDDENIKCYMKCVMEEIAVMNDKGEIDSGPISEIFPEQLKEESKKVLETCAKEAETVEDLCEKAHAIMECSHKTDPDNWYFF